MAVSAKYALLAVVGGAAAVEALSGTSPYIQAKPADKTGRVVVLVDRQRNIDGSINQAAYKPLLDKVIKDTSVKNVRRFDRWGAFAMDAKDTVGLKKALAHPLVLVAEDSVVVRPSNVETVRNAPKNLWGIDRIDSRDKVYDNKASFTGNGEGIDVYVIDTGINVDHQELKGRAFHFWTAFPKDAKTPSKGAAASNPWINGTSGYFYSTDKGAEGFFADDNGHGSHCAGTIAGKETGVAPMARTFNAKVFLNGGSTSSEIIWSALYAAIYSPADLNRRRVLSMSLGGTKSSNMYNEIIKSANELNVAVVVAAGNDNIDACTKAPAFSPAAITVGATDVNDVIATFSNWGTCVDIFAPGVNIYSAWFDGTYNAISGTSMACPHVAGAVAVLLSQYPTLTPEEIAKIIIGVSSEDQIKNIPVCPQSPNKLLYARFPADRIYFAKSGSGKTDAWCQANINDRASRDFCEIAPKTGCLATPAGVSAGVTDAWCKQVQCAAEYSNLCTKA